MTSQNTLENHTGQRSSFSFYWWL